ncbi:MAG: hypothetical protein WB789_06065 [Thermoplasmata archaeon]
MKLEIGPDGKIIGTRRVSPNGQVSGLTEFAGHEVLVILPGSAHPDSSPGWGSPEAVAQAVEEQMREVYQRYELLQKLYASPWEATRSFVRSAFGTPMPDLSANVDRWVKDQLRNSHEDRASPSDPSPERTRTTPSEKRSRAGRKRSSAQGTPV